MGKKLYRCKTTTAVLATELEFSRQFGRGQIVDLGEKVGKLGTELRELVRIDCFEELEPEPERRIKFTNNTIEVGPAAETKKRKKQ